MKYNYLIIFVLTAMLTFSFLHPKPASAKGTAPLATVPLNVKFDTVVTGLNKPLFVTHAGDNSNRLFIVQQDGKILIFKNGVLNSTPFLDVGPIISFGGERGLLCLAFDPNYKINGRFFVYYTNTSEAITIARYNVSNSDPDIADNSSGLVLLTIPKQYAGHNGGTLAFGPDGYLYSSAGDGHPPGDPENNGQNNTTLLGKILRLDVRGATYTIPTDNPFYGDSDPQVKQEIWASGLRNPWRMSFDRVTGDLYIGDVGQDAWEEVDFQPASSTGGENYGWRCYEGNHAYNTTGCLPQNNYVSPVAEYSHTIVTEDDNGCAITGGYVYRGTQFPALQGVYLYGDFCLGKLYGLVKNVSDQWVSTLIQQTNYPFLVITSLTSFGEDEQGEIYLTDYNSGTVFHIVKSLTPTVTTDSVTNVTSNSATLIGTVNAGGLSITAWFVYGTTSGLYDNTTPVQNMSGSTDTAVNADITGLLPGKTYYYRAGAENSAGKGYGSEKSFKTLDTAAPVGSIVIKGGDAYTNTALVTVGLSATDNVGVAGYYLSLSNMAPSTADIGWVAVTPVPGYSGTVPYTLSSGDGVKTVYVWYKDDVGNISSTASDSIDVDTAAPVVTITSPSSATTYTTTASPINLGGNVTESGSGIVSVTWSNNKGGIGTASGTTNWTIANISLTVGDTIITVTATDGAGNTGKDIIMVSYYGLYALYTFNEGIGTIAHDTSGNGNNGTINGATWTAGKKGSALSFNGTNSYVSLSKSLPSFSEFSCSAWVQVADLAVNRGVFSSGGSNTRGFRFRVNTDGSVWLLMAGGGTNTIVSTAAGIIKSGAFYHITVTGKSGQYMRIYVNGVLAKEKITTQTVTTPTAPGYIGTSWSTSSSTTSELMNGIIDIVRIYTQALSNQEVLDLYNMDYTTPPVPEGSISINNGKAYTNSPAVLLNLSATDDVGVVGYYLSSSNVSPSAADIGWVAVTPVPGYSGTVPYTLSSGDGSKTVYVWYKDGSGNISATASDSIDLDTTAPVVSITSPSSEATYTTTASPISLGGNVTEGRSGIVSVTWSTDRGGSGTASGTTSWTIANIGLAVGDTIITVMATDGAGNTGKDIITVSYYTGGLNALYTFNEGIGPIALDTSGNGNNGTINGATWTAGKKGSALSFNGTSSYVSLSTSLPAFSEFTCAAWVQLADLAVNRGVFTSGGSNTRGFRFRVNKDGSVWLLMAGSGTNTIVSTTAGIIKSGTFYHITVTGKSGQYMRIYVNGVLAKEKITTQTVTTPTAPGYIGTSWSTTSSATSELMNGIIDDVRIYNRALSGQEVTALYNAQ